MSQWTHVASCFRIDSFGEISDEQIYNVFGKFVSDDDWDDAEENPSEYLPCGSEGSLNISIWHNPSKHSIASTTVMAFGDLRDYNDVEALEEWFNKVCSGFMIRQAVMEIDVEFKGKYTLNYKEKE